MLETPYREIVESELSKHFTIESEVYDITHKSRIDMIVTCNKSNVAFGVEAKKTDRKTGVEIGELINQTIRYSKCLFPISGIYRKIPIFVVPQLSYDIFNWKGSSRIIDGVEYIKDRHNREHDHHGMNGLLGGLGIGEIRTFKGYDKVKPYYEFKFSNKTIWSSKPDYNTKQARGLHVVNYNNLIKKIC